MEHLPLVIRKVTKLIGKNSRSRRLSSLRSRDWISYKTMLHGAVTDLATALVFDVGEGGSGSHIGTM